MNPVTTIASLATLALAASAVHAGVIFSDDFSGGGADLHGSAPDSRRGPETWVAASVFNADGSIDQGAGSATLAFAPSDGKVYQLDASFAGVRGDGDWLAVGFAKGQSAVVGTNNRFINANTVGKAWMLIKGDASSSMNTALMNGTADNAAWTSFTHENPGGDMDMRILLDTSGGAGSWTATWFAKRPADARFIEVRPATTLLAEDIDSVGLALSNVGVFGTVESFSLAVIEAADDDGDGLADDWEIALFGDLSQGPRDDFDGDGFDNQSELEAGTDPGDANDFPLVAFIPVSDGNPATDENGYAGSGINSVAFAQNNLITVGDQQFIAYYRRHASDSNHPGNNTVTIARRNSGDARWEVFPSDFHSFNIDDNHNVISCAIDGDGFLHMSWGMHANPLLYAKSTTSVLGAGPIVMASLGAAGMTGQENRVTYPKFLTLPDGDVVFLFREGGSGNGDWYLHRYDTATDRWAPVHANGSGVHQPLMKGTGHSPDNCFYPDRMTLGPDGLLHLAGVFRYNDDSPAGQSGYQTNHRYVYLRSPDGGTTWQRSDGSAIDLPVVEDASFQDLGASHVPEIVEDIPEGHSNMNEAGMTTDSAGNPIIANWWATDALSGDHTRQYHIYFHDGTRWQRRTISARTIDNPAQRFAETQLSNSWMGRPVVLTDSDDRIIVLYNDNRSDGITVVFSEPLAQDPGRNNWTRMNLTSENLGRWEVTYDEPRWKRDGVLQMLYQKLPGSGASYTAQNNSTPVSVLEWKARAYFNRPVRWFVDTETTPGQATIWARTRTGFRYQLETSTDLRFAAPPAASLPGDGTWQNFGSWPTDAARRFWRMERLEEANKNL